MPDRERLSSLLEELSDLRGPSGAEGPVRDHLKSVLRDVVDDLRVDALGNLLCYKHGAAEGAPTLMIAAHMDEVGMMVTVIKDNGLLSFAKVGGIDDRVLLSKKVLVGPDAVPGVIGSKPVHLQKPDERKKVVKADEMTVDIGASSKAEAEKLVKLGDYITFAPGFTRLGNSRVLGKAFDDRAGCAILAEVLHHDYPVNLVGVFTVQEEIGLRGAQVAAYAVDPDYGVALEGTLCADIPDSPGHGEVTRLGDGPVITFKDRGTIYDRRLVGLARRLAEDAGIPWQWKRGTAGGNDAAAISRTRGGVPSLAVSVPCRYVHTPRSMLDIDDLVNSAHLTHLFAKNLEGAIE